MTKNNKGIVRELPKLDEAEEFIRNLTRVPVDVLKLHHSKFSIRIINEVPTFHIEDSLMDDLYDNDMVADYGKREYTAEDFLFQQINGEDYASVYFSASYINKIELLSTYKPEMMYCQAKLMLYIMSAIVQAKFGDIKTIADITKPVPLNVFTMLANKEENLKVILGNTDVLIGGTLNRMAVHNTMFGTFVQVDINVITKGDEYIEGIHTVYLDDVPEFVKSFDDFKILTPTDDLMAELNKRGKKYVEVTSKPTYAFYKGFATDILKQRAVRSHFSGRVMIDICATRTMNPHVPDEFYCANPFYTGGGLRGMLNRDMNRGKQTVAEADLWRCVPYVYGFSFITKKWIRMEVANLSEVVFSDKAFDNIIIPEEHKHIITSCLNTDLPSLDDIEGKGNGKIFLLTGKPGTGKTLSAESIAEYKHLPLYFVSVGELGIEIHEVERNLDKLMSIAESWGAVVLLDEVDVFAMKRDHTDIERNALTAIFLRLLERYDGIMFMTTNLIGNIDDAFISRATAVIEYTEFSPEVREKIWSMMIQKLTAETDIKVDPIVHASAIVTNRINELNLNGRDMKNMLRLAYAVANNNKDKTLTEDVVMEVLNLKTKSLA